MYTLLLTEGFVSGAAREWIEALVRVINEVVPVGCFVAPTLTAGARFRISEAFPTGTASLSDIGALFMRASLPCRIFELALEYQHGLNISPESALSHALSKLGLLNTVESSGTAMRAIAQGVWGTRSNASAAANVR